MRISTPTPSTRWALNRRVGITISLEDAPHTGFVLIKLCAKKSEAGKSLLVRRHKQIIYPSVQEVVSYCTLTYCSVECVISRTMKNLNSPRSS